MYCYCEHFLRVARAGAVRAAGDLPVLAQSAARALRVLLLLLRVDAALLRGSVPQVRARGAAGVESPQLVLQATHQALHRLPQDHHQYHPQDPPLVLVGAHRVDPRHHLRSGLHYLRRVRRLAVRCAAKQPAALRRVDWVHGGGGGALSATTA